MLRLILAAATIPFFVFAGALHASAVDGPAARALAILIAELKREGFEDVTVTQRIFGGYVIEAESEDAALLVSLDANDFSPQLIESFSLDSQTGFFGTVTRPLDDTAQTVISRYTARLGSARDPGPNIDLTGLFREHPSQPVTAGFTQDRSITATENSVIIRQTETLGMLSPITTTTITSTDTQGSRQASSTHSVDQRATFSTQHSETVIQMTGTDAFNSEIFTSPNSVRDTITQGISLPPAGTGINQTGLIDQIVATTETLAGNLPNGLPENFPTNIRSNIDLILNPPD